MSSNVIGRQPERSNILDFVATCESKSTGAVLYCAGAPGTGKTLCVQNVLNSWVKDKSCKQARRYDYVNVIGLNDHLRLFTSIESLIRGKSYVTQIRKRGRSNAKIIDNAEPFAMVADCVDSVASLVRAYDGQTATCVLVIDELDYLCPSLSSVTRGGNSKSVITAKKQLELIRSLFLLPQKLSTMGSKITLVIIGIANSIDLAEKLTSLTSSCRGGRRLIESTLLFRPYDATELKAIVNQITNNSLDADALELCSRKVATVHGDCRKVIDLCKQATNNKRRRTETTDHPDSSSASIVDLLPAIDQAFKSHSESVSTLKSLPLQQLFVLVAACRHAVAHPERTDFPITDLKTALNVLVKDLNVPFIDVGQVSTMMEHVMALSNCGFMTLKSKGNQINVVRSDMFWRLNTPSERLQDTLMKTNAVIASALGAEHFGG